jgi:hypothetical protein
MTPQEVQRVGFPCSEHHSDGIEKHSEVHGHLLEPEVIINVKQEPQVNKIFAATFQHKYIITYVLYSYLVVGGDHGNTVVKVLCYKSEGLWFGPRWCHGIFH